MRTVENICVGPKYTFVYSLIYSFIHVFVNHRQKVRGEEQSCGIRNRRGSPATNGNSWPLAFTSRVVLSLKAAGPPHEAQPSLPPRVAVLGDGGGSTVVHGSFLGSHYAGETQGNKAGDSLKFSWSLVVFAYPICVFFLLMTVSQPSFSN